MAKEAVLQTVWLGLGEDGILRIRILENATITFEQAKLQEQTIHRLIGDSRVPVLIDAREPYSWEKEAQQYIADHAASYRIATAVITNNPVSRLITNTYVSIFKPSYPVKLFTEESKAIEWLKGFKDPA